MALIKCHECGNEISTSARSCPKCGAPAKVQPKPLKKRPSIVLLIPAAVVLYGIVTYFLPKRPNEKEPQVDVALVTESHRDVGSDAILRVSSGDVVLSVDSDAYDDFVKLATARDYLGMGQMEAAGRIFRVPSGTKARIIDSSFERRQVRIMEGSSFGRSGWVTYTAVL